MKELKHFVISRNHMKSRPSVSLQNTKTRHIICKAHINGVAAITYNDTGASSSCIHSKLEEHFHLRSKGDPFDAAGAK